MSIIPSANESLVFAQESLTLIQEKKRLEELERQSRIEQYVDEFTQTLVLKIKAECREGRNTLVYPLLRYSMPLMFPESYYILKETQKRFTEAGYVFNHIDGQNEQVYIAWGEEDES